MLFLSERRFKNEIYIISVVVRENTEECNINNADFSGLWGMTKGGYNDSDTKSLD